KLKFSRASGKTISHHRKAPRRNSRRSNARKDATLATLRSQRVRNESLSRRRLIDQPEGCHGLRGKLARWTCTLTKIAPTSCYYPLWAFELAVPSLHVSHRLLHRSWSCL